MFVGFPDGEAKSIVESIFALIAGAGVFREKIKGATVVSWKTWITQVNTWNYIGAAVVAIVPSIPAQLFTDMRNLMDSLIGGNWQGIVTAVFSIATMLYYIFKKK